MPNVKIGLEVHGYLAIENMAKLFCDCKLGEALANTNICPVCTAMPGSKPMLPNFEALDKTVAICGMLGCTVNKRLLFQRKHYSWPDLPSGYQKTISGSYSIPVGELGNFLDIGITDVHLEEDPARWQPETGYVDYNRSGYPLVEIVTEPDFKSSGEVRGWLKKLMTTLSYIKGIDPDAGIKCDVNVSIGPKYNRVEIKNVNSFKSIIQAIEYEVRRQEKALSEGQKIGGETRAWNDQIGTTVFVRTKENAMDYMFIPEPDLPAISLDNKHVEGIIEKLPERPLEKENRYIKEFRIDKTDAQILSSEILLAELFEKMAKAIDPVLAARWLRRELLRVLNYNKKDLEEVQLDENQLMNLLKLIHKKKITDETGKNILEKLIEKNFDVEKYVMDNKLTAVSDIFVLEKFTMEVISENSKAVEDYKSGNEKALNFLMGKVMGKSKGKATPGQVTGILKRLIG